MSDQPTSKRMLTAVFGSKKIPSQVTSAPAPEEKLPHSDRPLDPSDRQNQEKDRLILVQDSATQPGADLVATQLSHSDLVATQLSCETTQSNNDSVSKRPSYQTTKSSYDQEPGFRIPNILEDQIIPTLTLPEQSVLRRLFRLSYGFNRQYTDSVSLSKLSEKCNMGQTAVKSALKSLQGRGLIAIESDLSRKPNGGNKYSVLTGLFGDLVARRPSPETTKSPSDHIKDHDLNNTSHHQREVMTIYQSITSNQWTKKDDTAYQQIKNIPLDQISITIRQVLERAPQHPATLAYFVKEILSPTPVNAASRSARRAQMERIIREVRDAHQSINGYLLSNFVADVKEACAKEGVVFDNDLFNEITNRTSYK